MLSPDSVGDVQADILFGFTLFERTPGILASRGKRPVQRVECGMKIALREPVVKGVRHLAFRLAPGSSKGHGKGLGDAEGGIEQVAFFVAQSPVKVEGKVIVPLHQFSQVRPGGWG